MDALKIIVHSIKLQRIFGINHMYANSLEEEHKVINKIPYPKLVNLTEKIKTKDNKQDKQYSVKSSPVLVTETTKQAEETKTINKMPSEPAISLKQANKTTLSKPRKVNSIKEEIEKIYNELKSINKISELKEYIENFNSEFCNLQKMATNTVFADGNPNSDVMLIGEAPGEEEDKMGIPFCGRSGLLLDEVLKSINLSRKQNIYISNSVFWRPPANRKPKPEEIEICKPLLEKHIQLINPKLIISCGATALVSLTGKVGITQYLSEQIPYKNAFINKEISIIPIYHPAFLLRNPIKKRVMWSSLIRIKKYLNDNT